MKTKYTTTALLIVFLLAMSILSGCSKDDGGSPSPMDKQQTLLENGSKSWVLVGGSVLKGDIDVSNEFAGFKLTVTGFNYVTENSPSGGVWASQGTWTFKDNQVTAIERNDGVLMTIDNISSTDLVLRFTDPDDVGGRYSSIIGDYVFTLKSE
jgi:hypothetical protein